MRALFIMRHFFLTLATLEIFNLLVLVPVVELVRM